MNDLINRQDAIDAVERAKTARSEDGEIFCAKINAQMNIQLLPTIDAVEIVRCKDCKYGEIDDENFPWQYLCNHNGDAWNDENHFCSYAERK